MAASGVFSLLLRYCFQICDTKTTDALDIFELPICWGSILQLAGSCAIDAALHLFMRLQPERLASAKGGESNCWWLKDPAWPECFSDHRKNGERQPTTWAPNRSLYRKWGYNYKPSKWPEIKWETVFFFFLFHPCTWRYGPRLVTGFRGPILDGLRDFIKKSLTAFLWKKLSRTTRFLLERGWRNGV